jgi:hypothetical protein
MSYPLTAEEFTLLHDKQLSYLQRAIAIMDALPDNPHQQQQAQSQHAANLAGVSLAISEYVNTLPRSID